METCKKMKYYYAIRKERDDIPLHNAISTIAINNIYYEVIESERKDTSLDKLSDYCIEGLTLVKSIPGNESKAINEMERVLGQKMNALLGS